MLCVQGLSKTFISGGGNVKALRDVSVDVEKGEIFGFIGQSGAGKSTLARCVSMLEVPDSGRVIFGGEDITTLRGKRLLETRKRIGFVFQHFNLLMNSTVEDNIAFPLRIAKTPKEKTSRRVTELLDLVGLSDKRNTYPSKLSGGQKQRVGIARALAGEPELVICDEATSSLDPDTTGSILELIRRINRRTGVTFLVITHEMGVIKELCSKVAVMEDGRIIECGSVLDVLSNPKTDTARRFFQSHDAYTQGVLPESLTGGEMLVRAVFIGDAAMQPFISNVIRRFDVEISIMAGGIEPVGETIMGALVLKLSGKDEALASSIKYFRENGVGIEVISNAE